MNRAVGILGGAFDPPHFGHLHLAARALADLPLSELWMIPNGHPPHRSAAAEYPHRLAMLKIAAAALPNVFVRELEPLNSRPHFTAETLSRLRTENPSVNFTLLLGGDSFGELEKWHSWREIFSLVNFAVAPRDSKIPLTESLEKFCSEKWVNRPAELTDGVGKIFRWECCAPSISASDARKKITDGKSIDKILPPPVADYIAKNEIYRK